MENNVTFWKLGGLALVFEGGQNVTLKRVGLPSSFTVYRPLSHKAGCAWGKSIPLQKRYFWDGAWAGPGDGSELRAGDPDPHVTCHRWAGAPCPAGLSGPVWGMIGPAEGEEDARVLQAQTGIWKPAGNACLLGF